MSAERSRVEDLMERLEESLRLAKAERDRVKGHLPHTPEALLGKHVRITRYRHRFTGVVTSAGPHTYSANGLSLLVRFDDGSEGGFHLPPDATVELLDGAA